MKSTAASGFELVLAKLQVAEEPPVSREVRRTIPLESLSVPTAGGDLASIGGHSQWEAVLDDDAEAASPLPCGDAAAIERELDLRENMTAEDLGLLRRRFMWANHPDRRPEIPNDLSGERVAVANMLIDRALSRLSRRSP